MALAFIYRLYCRSSTLFSFHYSQVSGFCLRGLGKFANRPYSIGRPCCHLTDKTEVLRHQMGCIGILKKQSGFPSECTQLRGFAPRGSNSAALGSCQSAPPFLDPLGRGADGEDQGWRQGHIPAVRVIQRRMHDAAQATPSGLLSGL